MIEPRIGGSLEYDMVADTPEMVEAMRQAGQPASHGTRGRLSELRPMDRLALTHVIDFIPGVPPYESTIVVDLIPTCDRVRMVVTLDPMHDGEMSKMQAEGFTSQLTKLDRRSGE